MMDLLTSKPLFRKHHNFHVPHSSIFKAASFVILQPFSFIAISPFLRRDSGPFLLSLSSDSISVGAGGLVGFKVAPDLHRKDFRIRHVEGSYKLHK